MCGPAIDRGADVRHQIVNVPWPTSRRRAPAEPHAPALADDAVTLDNAAFADRVARAAALLDRLGVRAGDVVAIAMPNRVELIIALFAAWRLGAAATPVNPALTPTEMQYQVDDAGAKVVIGDGLELDATVVDVDALAAEPSADRAAADIRPDSLALLIYTSGTTGKPKGVMLDHANIAAMCDMTRGWSRHHHRPQPADPSALPRQRHRRRDADAVARRWPRDGRGPLQPEDLLSSSSGSARRTSRPCRRSTRC